VHSRDSHHLACYSFWKNHQTDVHVFPALAWFEVQATLSRIERGGGRVLREMYLLDEKNYVLDIGEAFIQRAVAENLHNRFSTLRGADLVFACAAVIERASLVTCDAAFLRLEGLDVIIPT
jgi:predicted nucleic acid-binding protein